jgi:hypothetical protein
MYEVGRPLKSSNDSIRFTAVIGFVCADRVAGAALWGESGRAPAPAADRSAAAGDLRTRDVQSHGMTGIERLALAVGPAVVFAG